mmetsp:Transcript_16884/g.36451  ORF Transcript_16884/g.36451 Transcript_16884/m.36451 type:complete len:86 (+) Transcript_16884:1885-2142(+)
MQIRYNKCALVAHHLDMEFVALNNELAINLVRMNLAQFLFVAMCNCAYDVTVSCCHESNKFRDVHVIDLQDMILKRGLENQPPPH